MNYFPWEAGGGSNNLLYTKHDCISSQNHIMYFFPDLLPVLGRLWWDETIPTVVTRATQSGIVINTSCCDAFGCRCTISRINPRTCACAKL
ncbi:hypothetical protein MKW98_007422 [Papaver atlanticum]|uniref:Uncharacterized protein n=1 Tax=Papaver atlanticum TaxID=357466 RepID=A0AAD4XCI6_9MAGN|nr:hypothetical protein MKW98_007422 [Papaver atlanticum]